MKISKHMIALLALGIFACQEKTEPTTKKQPAAEPSPAKKVKVAQAKESCVGPLRVGEAPQEVSLGGKTYIRDGYKLALKDGKGDKEAVFGVIANTREAIAENISLVKAILSWFKSEGAQAIIFPGDVGEKKADIVKILNIVAESGLPVFVTIGNREGVSEFNAAIAEVQKAHRNVVNMNQVRHVDGAAVDLVSLPGYHDPRYLHQGAKGCRYYPANVQALEKVAKGADSPTLLVSHGPPKGVGTEAIDRAVGTEKESDNVGDPDIALLIQRAGIKFGVFSNIQEAGGKATGQDLKSLVPEGEWSEYLFLNPGGADTVAWMMNDGNYSQGMAALMRIKEGKASYKIYHSKPASEIPPPTAGEKKGGETGGGGK